MSLPNMQTNGASILSSDLAYHDEGIEGVDAIQAGTRYGEERAKRLRDEGNRQFIEPALTKEYQHFQDDPWVDPAAVKDLKEQFPDGRCRFLIVGAGFGGLMHAVRLIEAGFDPRDVRIIDTAGGFGGAWYWNRFPGLSCDIESYIYLPFLEETGYVPRHRYASGDEIRSYANLVAEKWHITGVFQTKSQRMQWDETAKEWKVELLQQRKGEQPQTLEIRSQFIALANGPLNWPKLPDIPGILDYKGDVFHSARWNYAVTGGSAANAQLSNLKDKRVAIVGTGATAVQIVPELARWAKHVYVVQRTPSAVDERGQRETDPAWFKSEVATGPDWQRERIRNFHAHFTTEKLPETNLVDDQWTHAHGMVAVAGNPDAPRSMEQVPDYIGKLHAIDLPRQNWIRQRVKRTVKDPDVAEKLTPWYPTWCKRPCFHDSYLTTFNKSNVSLLDTAGKGLEGLTTDSLIVNGGKSYPVDIIIFATGFRAPFIGSPADKGNMRILGRGGISMSEAWQTDGPSTLHGVLDVNFPNLLLSGPWQAALSGNNTFSTGELAKHAAYIVAKAERKARGKKFVLAATKEGVEGWGMELLMRAAAMAPLAGCTPGYFNVEGDMDRVPPEGQMKLARSGLWGAGVEDFADLLEGWRRDGDMKGVEVLV